MTRLIVLAFALLLPAASLAAPQPGCTTAKEYITALEFLRNEKALKLPEAQARKLASEVAQGCTGAANRFIRISRLLMGSGLTSPDALKIGRDFASRTERETDTFLFVFKTAFLENQLDLDLGASVSLAKSLTLEFEGDIHAVRNDFTTVLDYCLGRDKLDLPRPRCAKLASDIARAGQASGGGVARPFVEALQLLRSHPGPNLSTGDALKIAQDLVKYGPEAPRNFTQGYRYATAETGLNLPRNEAIAFARELAAKSLADEKSKTK
ncbi:MAG: hypothetical protein NDJ90_08905 [Oligoflexia bacterium]|nr:hypothetical protein [Oligoflexia bacterium]